jgi:hypothetical protein
MATVVETVNFIHENFINLPESVAILEERTGGTEE